MKPVLIVTATKCKTIEEFKERPIWNSLETLYEKRYTQGQFNFEVVTGNESGLSEVYNRFIDEKYSNKIVLFLHDDIEIHDLFLVEKLNQSPWDITGVAGGSDFKIIDKNLWHLCTSQSSQTGTVSHPLCFMKDNQLVVDKSQQVARTFGPWPKRCLILDGLFIAVNIEKALASEFKFDEDFTFHFYDISSCLEANRKKLKIGTYPINVLHHGLGDSYTSPVWEKSNEHFKNKWRELLKK